MMLLLFPALWNVLLVAQCVVIAIGSPVVNNLTVEEFVKIRGKDSLGNPEVWAIRLRAPWDPVATSHYSKDLFAATAELMNGGHDSNYVQFGELLLNQPSSWAVLDGLGLTANSPMVLLFGTTSTRALGVNGGREHGRVLYLPVDLQYASRKSPEELKKTILSRVPTRFHDAITTQSIDAINFVFSRKEVYQISALKKEQLEHGVISVMPTRALVYRLRLTSSGDEEHLAAISAAAAQSGANTVVFVTEDSDVAARFGVHENRAASVFQFPFPEDVSIPIHADKTSEVLEGPHDAAALILATRSTIPKDDTAEVRTERLVKEWQRDVHRFMTTSPLRRLDTTQQLFHDVMDPKGFISVLFVLRESDDYFNKHFNTAVDVAKTIQTSFQATGADGKPHPLSEARQRIRYEAFWIDAEVHKQVATSLKVPSVPCVVMLYATQDGRHAGRFVFGGKKHNEFPTLAEMVSFLSATDRVLEQGRDMFPVDLKTFTFTPANEVEQFYRTAAQTPKKLKLKRGDDNNRYLLIDRKIYLSEQPKENTFVRDMIEGKVKFEKRDSEEESSKSKQGTKSNAKAEARKKARQEAEKKKLEEELRQKQLAREARMKKKAEEDQVEREKAIKEAKEAMKEEARRAKVEDASTSSSGSKPKAENIVERPKFSPSKGPKNRFAQKKAWEVDTQTMMKARLFKDEEGQWRLRQQFEL